MAFVDRGPDMTDDAAHTARQTAGEVLAFIREAGATAWKALRRATGLTADETKARAIQAIYETPHGKRLEALLGGLRERLIWAAVDSAMSDPDPASQPPRGHRHADR
jgi:hypothetical protein